MTVRRVHANCENCGMLGPEAPSVPEARTKAGEHGWLITTKRTDKRDYCPACRPAFEPKMCAVRHVDNTTGIALYELSADERTVHSCGMHSPKLQRELFAGGVTKITVTLISSLGQQRDRYVPRKSVR